MSVNNLKKIECLSKLNANEFKIISEKLERIHLKTGDCIFKENDKSNDLYFVTEGSFEVLKICRPDYSEVINVVKAPTLIGEMAFLIDTPRAASLMALQDCELFKLAKKDFQRMSEGGLSLVPKLLLYFASTLSYRLYEINSKLCAIVSNQPKNRETKKTVADLENFRNKLYGQWSF